MGIRFTIHNTLERYTHIEVPVPDGQYVAFESEDEDNVHEQGDKETSDAHRNEKNEPIWIIFDRVSHVTVKSCQT